MPQSPGCDIEMALKEREYANGFASVAEFIVKDSDKTSTVFRRFDRLAARNLLYLQARLLKLQAIQDDLDEEDLNTQNKDLKRAATSWEDFENLANKDSVKKRIENAERIQEALKTYRKLSHIQGDMNETIDGDKDEALLLQSRVLALNSPSEETLKAFKEWFAKPTRLRGHSSKMLDDGSDLVALKIPASQDRLTKLVQAYCPWLFLTEAPTGSVAYISEQKVARFVAFVSTFLAAMLLIGAIVALHCAVSQNLRIALVGIFTAAFAGSVGLLTAASRAEVFAATAAYAAVLVVFISGNQPDG